jgi:hypothetical protein
MVLKMGQAQTDKTKTLVVHEGDTLLKGLPFYIKRGRVTHETSRIETLATLTLAGNKIQLDDKGNAVGKNVDFVGVKTVSLSIPRMLEEIATLQVKIQTARAAGTSENQQASWDEVQAQFHSLPIYDGSIPGALPLERNVLTQSSYVDYSKPFYLNKVQPLSGSSEIDISLAADGTLTKASAKGEDKTFEQLLSFIPKADTLIDKTKTAPAEEAETKIAALKEAVPLGKGKYRIDINLEIKNSYVRHIWFLDVANGASYIEPLEHPNRHWYRRELIPEPETKVKEPASNEKITEKADE